MVPVSPCVGQSLQQRQDHTVRYSSGLGVDAFGHVGVVMHNWAERNKIRPCFTPTNAS